MKIAMLASESNPLIKTGGLADVVYSLSKALSLKGHEVIVALPFYKSLRLNGRKVKEIGSYNVTMSWRHQEARIYLLEESGIRFYLIGNPYYFERDGVYGYPDDNERFAFSPWPPKRFFASFRSMPILSPATIGRRRWFRRS